MVTFVETLSMFHAKLFHTLQLGDARYFGLGGFTPVLNRSNGNQGWLTFFPRNACTRTVTLTSAPHQPGERSLHAFHHYCLTVTSVRYRVQRTPCLECPYFSGGSKCCSVPYSYGIGSIEVDAHSGLFCVDLINTFYQYSLQVP